MPEKKHTPFQCHIFVCTNDRHGVTKSCADGGSASVRTALKTAAADRGWRGIVRISQSGCLGVCDNGPNVMIYPQKIWFSKVTVDDVPEIMDTVAQLINQPK